MKAAIRIVLVSGVVVILALAAWNGVQAEKAAQSNNPAVMISNLFKPQILDMSSGSTEVEAETPSTPETPDAGEDNHSQQDNAAPEVAGTSEPGDDNQAQHESVDTPEASGEVTGTITAITLTSVTIDGVVYNLASGAEVSSTLQVGDTVKLEFVTNADGTISVREIKPGSESSGGSDDSSGSGNDSSGDNHGGGGSDDGSGGHHGGGDGGGGGGGGDGGSDG